MRKNKKIVLTLLCALFLSCLTGCEEIDEAANEATAEQSIESTPEPTEEQAIVSTEESAAESTGEASRRSVDDMLMDVLNNEAVLIDENGDETYLKDYQIGKNFFVDVILAEPTEYAFVDFDGDGENELVINISLNYGFLLVLHYDGETIRGYEFGVRALQSIKEDGSFSQSNGAGSVQYAKLSFENNQKNKTITAVYEYDEGYFEIEGKECSYEDLKAYSEMWNAKKAVEWKKVAK